MAEEINIKSTKRFGARYGRTVKVNFAKIEQEQRKLHKCPYCNKIAVKRLAAGIWNCRKCGAKFSGKAYTIGSASLVKEETEEKEEVKQENG